MRVKLCARCPYAPRDLAGHYDPELSAPPTGLASQARSPNHAQAAKEATYESQALRAVPLCTARLGRPLRSRSRVSRVREVRRRARDDHQSLSTRGPQETKTHNSAQYLRHDAAKRCAICDA